MAKEKTITAKDVDLLVKRLKVSTGLNQASIAKRIKYSRAHFSILKKNKPEELFELLQNSFANELKTVVEKNITAEMAWIRVLAREFANFKVEVTKEGNADDIVTSIENQANVILKVLK